MSLKSAYVASVRTVRPVLRGVGLTAFLERRPSSDWALWARSLTAIYDIDELDRLDLPWWTLAAVREVDRFLSERGTAQVFEWGSGASTLWLARRAARVVSIEHDAPWYDEMTTRVAALDNVDLRFCPPDPPESRDERYLSEKPQWKGRSFSAYVRAIDETDTRYDLIVIDGRARAACLEAARDRLAPGGCIVFDNSGRKRYRQAIEASPCRAMRFRGLTACLPYPDETTLLFGEG